MPIPLAIRDEARDDLARFVALLVEGEGLVGEDEAFDNGEEGRVGLDPRLVVLGQFDVLYPGTSSSKIIKLS